MALCWPMFATRSEIAELRGTVEGRFARIEARLDQR